MSSTFEQQVLPHLGSAYSLARWLVGDPVLAQDVTQEAMLRAFRYQAGLQGDAKPWLLQIVRHVAYGMAADRRRHPVQAAPVQLAGLPDPCHGPEELLGRKEQSDQLRSAIAALPADLRECLVLREFEALSYKEIAVVTGVPIGTVMSRLWRARHALLENLPE